MERTTEHFHAEARYPGHPDGDDDQRYRDLDEALARAEEQAVGRPSAPRSHLEHGPPRIGRCQVPIRYRPVPLTAPASTV